MPPQLSISDRPHRWMFRSEVPSFEETSHLGQESSVEHRAKAPFDSGVQFAAFKGRERKFCNIDVGEYRHSPLLQLRDGLARQPVHLEGALNTLRIVGMNSGRGRRIH